MTLRIFIIPIFVVLATCACTGDDPEPGNDTIACGSDETFDRAKISDGEAIDIAFPHLPDAACERLDMELNQREGNLVWDIHLSPPRPTGCSETRHVDAMTGELLPGSVSLCP